MLRVSDLSDNTYYIMDRYDVVIIGSGPGGYVSAIRAAQKGLNVCLIEKDSIGGTCLNYGCIPTKAVLAGLGAQGSGLRARGIQKYYDKVIGRKDTIVGQLREGIKALLNKNKIRLINGRASIISPNEIMIVFDSQNEQRIQAKNIIIATGSYPKPLKSLPFKGESVVSSQQILLRHKPPKRLLIIGAGPEGCEFAAIFNSLGVKVTLLEKMAHILPKEDADISKRLEGYFKRDGVEVLTSADILKSLKDIKADCILVCIGRTPNIEGLGLNEAGVCIEGGFIKVDDSLRTDVPNIYAIGDAIGSGLAHIASYEGILAVENIMGGSRKRDYRVVPNCIFTYPEIASVGLSEDTAKVKGLKYKAVKFPYSSLGVSHCAGKTEGFVKLIGDTNTEKLLGGCIIGHQAVTLIHTLAIVMRLNASMRALADTIAAHPTFSEVLKEAAASFYREAIHSVV